MTPFLSDWGHNGTYLDKNELNSFNLSSWCLGSLDRTLVLMVVVSEMVWLLLRSHVRLTERSKALR